MIQFIRQQSLPKYSSMITKIHKATLIAMFLIIVSYSQPTPSDSCVQYNANNSVCTKCLPGLYLQYFFCIPCNPLCACSSDQNYCESCLNVTLNQRTFMAYRSGDVCQLCNATIPFCLQCTINLTCTRCMMGRYLSNGMCSNITCTQSCQLCKNSTNCQVCSFGYYISTTQPGTCSSSVCARNCYECSSPDTCKICNIEFFPDKNGICQPCIGNCSICLNANTCQVCLPSFIPSNGSCIDTGLSNCIQYNGGADNPTCLVCEPGYYNAQGSCNQCSGCLLCTASFLCQTPCMQGFNPFNYACIQSQSFIYIVYSFLFIYVLLHL